MATDTQSSFASKAMYWGGWVATALPVLMLTMSAMMKLTKSTVAVEGLAHFGFNPNVLIPLGITEIVCTILYLIPQTAVLGAILLTGYLGGATVTHVRAGEPFIIPVIVGMIVWLGLFLRDPRLRALVPWRT